MKAYLKFFVNEKGSIDSVVWNDKETKKPSGFVRWIVKEDIVAFEFPSLKGW